MTAELGIQPPCGDEWPAVLQVSENELQFVGRAQDLRDVRALSRKTTKPSGKRAPKRKARG